MKLIHPQQAYRNLPTEDVFFAVDDVGTTHGTGYLMYQCQPSLDPACPVNIYFSITGAESVRFLLFGALMARARQIRDYTPTVPVRVYTGVHPEDKAMLAFCMDNELRIEDVEQRMIFPTPAKDGIIPMSCTSDMTPLSRVEEVQAFLQRMYDNDLTHITHEVFSTACTLPHFRVQALYHNGYLVGEAMMSGIGDTAELHGIYIVNGERRQGFGRALLHRTAYYMRAEGCLNITASLLTRSAPATRFLRSFGAQPTGVSMIYPSLIMEAPQATI